MQIPFKTITDSPITDQRKDCAFHRISGLKVLITDWDCKTAESLGGNPLCSLAVEILGIAADAPYWRIVDFGKTTMRV